jgi:nicotinate phosphoribosyltransferase
MRRFRMRGATALVREPHAGLGLFTDLYELTMAQAYHGEGLTDTAVFELFFRTLPAGRRFAVAAGLDDVLTYLESLHFSADDLDYLRGQGGFSEPFLGWLGALRFAGDVYAVPEGTVVFPSEPLVQVVAPIGQAQLAETYVLNQVHFQTVIATKAARIVLAARGRPVVDFGSRRAHGGDAALKAARVSYLVGAAGTSNVLAGKRYGIPIHGTMAHSYVQAHDEEKHAFEAFVRRYPGTTVLVDTYDTLDGVRALVRLARAEGLHFGAVRLDSGDLLDLSRRTRAILDDAGLSDVRIIASSGLDEHEIAALLAAGAPIDAFGVGTAMVVSRDAPDLDMAYKLVEYAGRPRTKLSAGKVAYPGRKQVFRSKHEGRMDADVIARHDETVAGRGLLVPVMREGRRLDAGRVSLADARAHCQSELESLPEALRQMDGGPGGYPVAGSPRLEEALRAMRERAAGS